MLELFCQADGGLSREQCAELERKRGQSFPSDFVEYLCTVNGGVLAQAASFTLGEDYTTAVGSVFGFNRTRVRDIVYREKLLRHYVPSVLLPVAGDTAGAELFFLDLRPESLGTIYLRAFNAPRHQPRVLDIEPLRGYEEEAELYRFVAGNFTQLIRLATGLRRRGRLA